MVKVETISESEDDEYKNLPVLSSRSYEQSQTKSPTETRAKETQAQAQRPQTLNSDNYSVMPNQTPSLYLWIVTLLVNSLLVITQASLQYALTPDAFAAESMINWATSWLSMLPVVYFTFRYGRKTELAWIWFALALLVGSRILNTLQVNQRCLRGRCHSDDLKMVPRLASLFILSALRMSFAKLTLGLALLSLYYLYLY